MTQSANTPPLRRLAAIAGLWALTAALLAAVSWGILGTTLYGLVSGLPVETVLTNWPGAFLYTSYFAGFIAAVAVPCYAVLFFAWLAVVRHWPNLEKTMARMALAALGFAVPLGVVFFIGYLDVNSPLGPAWREALLFPPMILLCTWIGIFCSRVGVRFLRPTNMWRAA
jgi:hypothetical protein